MKVYIVTSGCYSDYGIEAVFTDEVAAKAYANLDTNRQVEEYEADSVKVMAAPIKARIRYSPQKNEIKVIDTGEYLQNRHAPWPDEYYCGDLIVCRRLSARTLEDVKKHGTKSPLLLKAMQDAWAQYKAEHLLEREEDNAMKMLAGHYNILFASTSGTMGDDVHE